MYIESGLRSVAKAVSWRIFATATTIIIVYVIFGRLDLAVAAGIFETASKILIYFVHERIWNKVRFGKKRIEPFVVWFTGVPLSGKTSIADILYEKMKQMDYPIDRIDSKEVRRLIPEIGYERQDRIRHLKRIQHLVQTLQDNYISTVCSFVSPYAESRDALRASTRNFIEVYVKASPAAVRARDAKGKYMRAEKGEIKNFTGVSDVYEEPSAPEIVIDTDAMTAEDAAETVFRYLKKNVY